MKKLDRTEQIAPNALTQRRFNQIIITTVVVGFVALAGMVGMTGWLLFRAQEFGREVDHTYRVETAIADFQTQVEQFETVRRGYLISAGQRYFEGFYTVRTRLNSMLPRLRELTADNQLQTRRIDELQTVLAEKSDLLEQSILLRRSGDLMGANAAFANPRDQASIDRIRALITEMRATEQELLAGRIARQSFNVRLLVIVIGVAGLMLGVLAIISLWVMRRFATNLSRSQEELRRLNEGLEDAVRERTTDLTRANEEIQRFAYIVSHDLRSPLVNIMGFTSELEEARKPLQKLVEDVESAAPSAMTPEAKRVVEEEMPEAINFIRSSTRKMDRLINAILKLSREGRRTLNPEPLAMRPMVEGISGSLKKLAEEKSAEVIVDSNLPDLVSDRVAIEQVFSNLIENGLKYAKPGRPARVEVRGHLEAGRVIYEVKDNGRGIDPKDHERIFDLFRRAGVQDQQGEGIGLAHVRALVYRLGGLISCSSELDQGATFRLSLPPVLARPLET